MALKTSRRREHTDSPERLLGFSDAVFSIAITFLALDLVEVPQFGDGEDVNDFLSEHLKEYAVYFALFLVVGFIWWRHRLVFRNIQYRTPAITWLNIFILALVAVLPYPASLLGGSFGLGISLAVLILPLMLASYALWVLFETARNQNVMMPDVTQPTLAYVRSTVLSTSIIFTIGLAFALLSWALESGLWFYVSLLSLVLLLLAPPLLRIWVPRPDLYAAMDVRDGSPDLPEPKPEQPKVGQRLNWLDKLRLESEGMRFAIFSDGVFAISATLLVLKLKPNEIEGETVTTATVQQNIASVPWVPYLVTFFLIGLFWIHHVQLYERIVRQDTVLLWLNLILLMFVAFLPFPYEMVAQGIPDTVVPTVLYMTIFCGLVVVGSITMIYANYAKGVEAHLSISRRQRNAQTVRAIWSSSWWVAGTIVVALTQKVYWGAAIIIIMLWARPILLRVVRPDLVNTREE